MKTIDDNKTFCDIGLWNNVNEISKKKSQAALQNKLLILAPPPRMFLFFTSALLKNRKLFIPIFLLTMNDDNNVSGYATATAPGSIATAAERV